MGWNMLGCAEAFLRVYYSWGLIHCKTPFILLYECRWEERGCWAGCTHQQQLQSSKWTHHPSKINQTRQNYTRKGHGVQTPQYICFLPSMLWVWVCYWWHLTIKDFSRCFAWIEMVILKKGAKKLLHLCWTWFLYSRKRQPSCLNFHLLDSFDFSWTSWNIKCTFSSPCSPVNTTKHMKPSASIIGEKNPSACDKKITSS